MSLFTLRSFHQYKQKQLLSPLVTMGLLMTPHDNQYFLHHLYPTFLLMIHLVRRYYECHRVHAWNDTNVLERSGESTMHIVGYLVGIFHYLLLPFVFIPPPLPFNVNSIRGSENQWCGISSELTVMTKVVLIICSVFCLYFQIEQHRHHVLLASLRRLNQNRNCGRNSNTNGDLDEGNTNHGHSCDERSSSYFIPRGRWFEFVSCPHYLAEIGIYVSFAGILHAIYFPSQIETASFIPTKVSILNIGNQYKSMSLLLWVTVNLSISARSSHSWYKTTFVKTYPKHRKCLVPFLW